MGNAFDLSSNKSSDQPFENMIIARLPLIIDAIMANPPTLKFVRSLYNENPALFSRCAKQSSIDPANCMSFGLHDYEDLLMVLGVMVNAVNNHELMQRLIDFILPDAVSRYLDRHDPVPKQSHLSIDILTNLCIIALQGPFVISESCYFSEWLFCCMRESLVDNVSGHWMSFSDKQQCDRATLSDVRVKIIADKSDPIKVATYKALENALVRLFSQKGFSAYYLNKLIECVEPCIKTGNIEDSKKIPNPFPFDVFASDTLFEDDTNIIKYFTSYISKINPVLTLLGINLASLISSYSLSKTTAQQIAAYIYHTTNQDDFHSHRIYVKALVERSVALVIMSCFNLEKKSCAKKWVIAGKTKNDALATPKHRQLMKLLEEKTEEVGLLKKDVNSFEARKSNENKHLKARIKELEGDVRKRNGRIKELEALLAKKCLAESAQPNVENRFLSDSKHYDIVQTETVSESDFLSTIKNKRVVVYGGHENWQKKIRTKYPDLVVVKPLESAELKIIKNSDLVIFAVAHTSHPAFERVESYAKNLNVPFVPLNNYNLKFLWKSVLENISA